MLLKLTDLIIDGMENKLISTVIACDLSAAFDTVNHQILIKTFETYYGISGSVLNWIKSFTSQTSSVIVNNCYSEKKDLTLSVPQGGCSSALFLILYSATIFEEVKCDLFGFADDHIIHNQFPAGEPMREAETILDLEETMWTSRTG